MKAHKAAGPDFLPSSICKRFAFRLSEHFWPVILKTFLHLSEPLPLKGGVLHHIPKPNPSVRDVAAAQRGILVQSIFSKVMHRVCRPFPAKLMESRAPSLQVGGRAGHTYMFGSFVSCCFLGFARANSISAAVVFTDLVAAYYSVVREAVTGLDPTASIRDIAASLKLTEADLQELEMHARESPVLSGTDSSDFLRAVTSELHSDTWFHLSGDTRIVRTARGTRPGGCLADTIFCLLFQKVLDRRVPADMSNIPRIRWTGQRDLCLFNARSSPEAPSVTVEDVTYADDHASFVVAPSASLLETAVRNTAGRTLDSIAGHGLAANIGPRKTAALMIHRGAGAKQARERVFGALKGRLHVLREHNLPIQLDAVPQYRHLGTLLTHTGSLLPEVKARLGLARATLGEGRRKVFCCAQVLLSRRVLLFQVHVMSGLLAGAGAWPWLGAAAWGAFEQGITAMYRQLLRIRHGSDQHWSRDSIFVACGAPTPADSLAVERLRFLGQLLRNGPDEAWALLQHCPDSITGFAEALRWLSVAVCNTSHLPPLEENRAEWLNFACCHVKRWKGLLRRGLAWHQGFRRSRAAFQTFCRATWAPVPQPTLQLDDQVHACLLCKKAFSCSQSWASHAALQHGYRTKATRLSVGRRCRACGTEFSCPRRLRQHLGLSAQCLQSLERGDPSLLPVLDSPCEHVQARARSGRGRGHLPEASADICWPLLEELRKQRPSDDSALLEVVRPHVEPFPTLRNTLQFWESELEHSAQLDAVSDLLLCFSPFWLCEDVAERGNGPQEAPFHPDVRFLPWAPRPAGLPGLVLDFSESQASRVADAFPGGGWRTFTFARPPHPSLDFACAVICLPAPPCSCVSLWRTESCPLRVQRLHHVWLCRCLEWLRLAFRLTLKGRRCCVQFRFSASVAGELAQWLRSCAGDGSELAALSFSFHPNSILL